MRTFVIAIEVTLTDMEAFDPEKWIKRSLGSVNMRKVKKISTQPVKTRRGEEGHWDDEKV